ncbi:hypothetical protein [Cohaesibacter gelatinilyticus]|uniref:Restriction alleviation protein Lar n=1 Tax=Cohaesibacter gelatinilyticus TaxID=372072 RepID=A0A285PJ07_9HYPH|nr:hypothetical protein [Cohaesibacter gelatinilyticus]SNZ21705.1 hypothetical protein SAMN06265368_4830 [Cohaesibacter gelatinilyticus]
MSEIELKPCLYCKEKRVSIDIEVIEAPTEYNAIARCNNCDAQGPGAYRHETKEVAMTEAAGLWNARPLENAAKPYTYIGKDGHAVLARDLEDQRDAAHKRIEELEEASARLFCHLADAKSALKMHHRWHLDCDELDSYAVPDGQGGWIGLNRAEEYADSSMHDITEAILSKGDT